MVKANVGDVVRFDYPQGDEHSVNVVGRIMSIRDTDKQPIAFSSKWYGKPKRIKRSRYLLTIVLADGSIRSFYNGVMRKARKLTLAERSLLWVGGVSFPKFARV